MMKNRAVLLTLFLAVFMMLAFGTAICTAEGEFVLPPNLEIIDDEAFAGTGVISVVIPGRVEEIGDRAFANNEQLLKACVLGEETVLADRAFDSNGYLELSGFQGSFIQRWVKKKAIRFILLEQIRQKKEIGIIAFISERKENYNDDLLLCRTAVISVNDTAKDRYTGRNTGELKASCYTGKKSIYVQSRYFP